MNHPRQLYCMFCYLAFGIKSCNNEQLTSQNVQSRNVEIISILSRYPVKTLLLCILTCNILQKQQWNFTLTAELYEVCSLKCRFRKQHSIVANDSNRIAMDSSKTYKKWPCHQQEHSILAQYANLYISREIFSRMNESIKFNLFEHAQSFTL